MTANSITMAWNMADRLIDGDYLKDEESSQRAGYPIYRSTTSTEYICDLGDRLEVNKADGSSVNIWIVENEETKENRQAVQNEEAHSIETVERIAICVEGYDWQHSKAQKVVFAKLQAADEIGRIVKGGDLLVAWCETHGKRWKCVRNVSVNIYNQHAIIIGYVTMKQ